MKAWGPAVRDSPQGAVISIEVSAGHGKTGFPGRYNEWREAIGCTVPEPPERGRANRAVCMVVAAYFGIPVSQVRIISGHTSHLKKVLIEGLGRIDVMERLQSP